MSLADELLADFDESEQEEEEQEYKLQTINEVGSDDEQDTISIPLGGQTKEQKLMTSRVEELSHIVMKEIEDVRKVARLTSGRHLGTILQKIEEYGPQPSTDRQRAMIGNVEDDPEYRLVVEAMDLVSEIDQEIILVNKFVKQHYHTKFPELEQLVPNPLDYARTVKLIGNQMDLTDIDLLSILGAAQVMVVRTSATTTRGVPLSEKELAITIAACNMAEQLDASKRQILEYVQSRMTIFAPNLSSLLGTSTTANLVSITGGITKLAQTPGSNIPALGNKRHTQTGFALGTAEGAHGFLYHSPIIQRVASDYRKQAQRKVAAKLALVARIDALREYPNGEYGAKVRDDLENNMDKLQAPPSHRGPRALPAPVEHISKKRGGRRLRKMKELNAMTDIRRAQNRIKFGEQEEEVGFGDETEGLGMLGQSTGVRALAVDKKTAARLSKKTNARLGQFSGGKSVLPGGFGKGRAAGNVTSGLQTSLAFTPMQGIELVNPTLLNDAARERVAAANDKWFGGGTFTQIKK